MIQIHAVELPAAVESQLHQWQAEVDALPEYADRVRFAAARFRNAAKSAPFQDIRRALEKAAAGNARCMFCEDSLANEIDHLRPKALYPDACFSWPNYIYVCGVCNKAKSSTFAVFANPTRELVDVTRRRGHPIAPPLDGSAVLIHPRYEDPMRLLKLDIADSFYFSPLAPRGSEEHQRARYTIDLLKLNRRDPLVRQRRQYFETYLTQLEAYTRAQERGDSEDELRARRYHVRTLGHPTVWFEMRRQHGSLARLRALFANLPEALQWDSVASATNRWRLDD